MAEVDQTGQIVGWTIPALKSTTDNGTVATVDPTTDIFTTATPNALVNGDGPYLVRDNGGTALPGGTDASALPAGASAFST